MDLLQLMEEQPGGGGLAVADTRAYMLQLCRALEYTHGQGVVHRDVKPENLLVTRAHPSEGGAGSGTLKLCDFGVARELVPSEAAPALASGNGNELTHYCGSRWYRSPELLCSSTEYGVGVDVWAAGCIMAEMALGQTEGGLFQAEEEGAMFGLMQRLLGALPDSLHAR
jgi:serine/threonine protein kinase